MVAVLFRRISDHHYISREA